MQSVLYFLTIACAFGISFSLSTPQHTLSLKRESPQKALFIPSNDPNSLHPTTTTLQDTEPQIIFTSASDDLKNTWKPPLSTRGRYVVDADGKHFKLKAGNWHGASGTYLGIGDINDPSNHHAGEVAFQTPLCLDRTPIEEIVQSFLDLGVNTIRFPFSNEMIHSTKVPPDEALRANPKLKGLTPLQIYDVCIEAMTSRGLAVILNNHVVKSVWCCGLDRNARWNLEQSQEEWLDDWIMMVKRYKSNPRVVGADLYNEVRRDYFQDANWGEGGSTDWWMASQIAGTRIQRETNTDILIIIEGINWVGIPTQYTRHYRPELQPVRQLSHTLPVLDKLVYCAHFYAYTGPNATGGVDVGRSHDFLYRDLSPSQLEFTVNKLAFDVATTPGQHYTNPVWISEMGSAGRGDYLAKNRWWWSNFTSLLIKYDIDYAFWPLTGWHENAKGDLWALNAWSSQGERLSILDPDDWRLPDFKKLIQFKGKEGVMDQTPQWRMLSTKLSSMQMSNRLVQEQLLPQKGQNTASCPDGLRLIALNAHQDYLTGLCTDVGLGRGAWQSMQDPFVIVASLSLDACSQIQCPLHHHIVGFSSNNSTVKDITCAQTSHALISKAERYSRVVLFDQDMATQGTSSRYTRHNAEATSASASCADEELLNGVELNPEGRLISMNCHGFKSESDTTKWITKFIVGVWKPIRVLYNLM